MLPPIDYIFIILPFISIIFNTNLSSIDAKKATQNGYVEIEATNTHGITRSTSDSHPIIIHVDDISDLKDASSTVILNPFEIQ